jgi:hypothetical protein
MEKRIRRLVENRFGGFQDIEDQSFEVSRSEARWLVETGKAVIVKFDNKGNKEKS